MNSNYSKENDSIPRIITQFFSSVTEVPFVYQGQEYHPITLTVSPGLLRGFTCPENCGACCRFVSIDYLPSEQTPPSIEVIDKPVDFNNKTYTLKAVKRTVKYSDRCEQLDKTNGRCTIHNFHSFSCDFELIRFMLPKDITKPSHLTNRLRGRYWKMIKLDGTKGALCRMTPPTQESINDVKRRLLRLQDWCNFFEIRSKIPRIIQWIDSGDTSKSLILKPEI